jgi:hypothetical protein
VATLAACGPATQIVVDPWSPASNKMTSPLTLVRLPFRKVVFIDASERNYLVIDLWAALYTNTLRSLDTFTIHLNAGVCDLRLGSGN